MKIAHAFRFGIMALFVAGVVAFFAALVGQFVAPEHATAFGALGFAISAGRSVLQVFAPGLFMASAAFTDFLPGVPMSSFERSLYAEAQAVQRERGLDPIMTPGYLRSEVVLPATTQGFAFPIRSDETFNGQAIQPQEQRLNINDAFYITGMSVMFYQFVTATANPARVRAALQTFPNTTVFTTNAPEVECMYNGNLSLKVDSTQYITALDMNAFRFSEFAQQGQLIFTASTNGSNVWRNDEMFKSILNPLIRLNGSGKNVFQLTFPDVVASTLVALNSIGAVLYLRGWNASNAGSFRPGSR